MRVMAAVAAIGLAVLTLGVSACAGGGIGANAPDQAASRLDPALEAAISGAQRTPANTARDGWRKPGTLLSFWGLKPGMAVLEISPGGAGYWTEILAPYLKATGGRYIATGADLSNPSLSQGSRDARARYEARFADAAVWGQVSVVNFGPQSGPLGAPGSVDLVMTARNVHNFMANGFWDKVLKDSFAVLKPGGILAIEEHRANPGPQDPKAESGYVTEAFVVDSARRAGFVLAERSDVLANPKDTKNHPFGVWTLPPVGRTAPAGQPADPAFNRAPYDAIGESDRMALRFVKPKQ
jgi:predicted methyltransferase